MDETLFWQIIEEAGSPDQYSPEEQCDQISDRLASLSKADLIAFENVRQDLLAKAYTWPMLKACFIVLSYVSDDVFEDFRLWVMLNGKTRFFETIENPDVMADYIDVEDPIEEISGEPLLFVVEDAWEGDFEEIEKEVEYPELPDIACEWPPKLHLQREFPSLFKRFWNEDRIREIHGDS